jgi:branched-chain amino acid transport system permease protein
MRYLWFLLLLLPLLLSPFPFYLTLLNFFAIAALVALSLYVLTGLGGMTSFAQAAFMGMGAYATALLTVKGGYSPWLGLLLGLGLALVLALVLGGLTVRLKGHFLPLSTIAWQVALYILAGNLVWAHRGAHGAHRPPGPGPLRPPPGQRLSLRFPKPLSPCPPRPRPP